MRFSRLNRSTIQTRLTQRRGLVDSPGRERRKHELYRVARADGIGPRVVSFSRAALMGLVCSSVTINRNIPSLAWARAPSPRPSGFAPRCPNAVSVTGPCTRPSKRPPTSSALCSTAQEPQTLHHLCRGRVPDHILNRAKEIGFVVPTDMQRQSLPVLLSGRDSILHAQTGSGKTLAYLLLVFSLVDTHKFFVQALVVVPTRELGMQVTKVARMLAAKPTEDDSKQKTCTVMALLDGGLLKRHKSWLKAEPPEIIVATMGSLSQMLEKHILKLDKLRVLVVDEVDFMFNSSKQANDIRKLLTSHSSINDRQTVFASASIPQHNHFIHDCIQQKWTKNDVVHVHVSPIEPMPSRLCHKFLICGKKAKLNSLLTMVKRDAPKTGIIFVNEQVADFVETLAVPLGLFIVREVKKGWNPPLTVTVCEYLKNNIECSEVILLEEEMNINARTASLEEVRQRESILVATDIAGRGLDLPGSMHIYNFDLPKTAICYLHRAGRTGRQPFSDEKCFITNLITPEERFVLQKFENELMFQCDEIYLN